MANITLWGTSVSDVPALDVPKTGGGTARFYEDADTVQITQNGTHDVKGIGTAVVNVQGGGGLTSVVRGEFKYTEEGWYTISLPYTGNGWPIAVIVSPKGGRTNSPIMTEIRRYAIIDLLLLLFDWTTQPIYDGTPACRFSVGYKNSTSDASNIVANTGSGYMYSSTTTTTTSSAHAFRVSANTEIKVRMVDKTHNTSRYGFLVDIDYEYIVIYSS